MYVYGGASTGVTWYVDDLVLSTVASAATSTSVWSYPNFHGDVQAVADAAGVKQGATLTYDPYGNTLGGVADNQAGLIDNGWLGQHQRPLEHQTGLAPLIEMGDRGYSPALGRFLEVDPIEGGTTTNDYGYVGDPINMFDLDGRGGFPGGGHKKKPKALKAGDLPSTGEFSYKPPKKGRGKPFWNGERKGWEDSAGNIWKPDKSGHRGPHWDVTPERGGGHTNVSPEGKILREGTSAGSRSWSLTCDMTCQRGVTNASAAAAIAEVAWFIWDAFA
jgi:RHS repeat-associated protein